MPFLNLHYIVIISATTDDNINFIINNIVCVIIVIVNIITIPTILNTTIILSIWGYIYKVFLIKSARVILLDPGVDISKYRQ